MITLPWRLAPDGWRLNWSSLRLLDLNLEHYDGFIQIVFIPGTELRVHSQIRREKRGRAGAMRYNKLNRDTYS